MDEVRVTVLEGNEPKVTTRDECVETICVINQKGEPVQLVCLDSHPKENVNKDWVQSCLYYIKPEKPHWTETVKPKPDHEFVQVCGRWVELHVDLIYGVTPYQQLQRKWKAWKQNLKDKVIQLLIRLLSISGQQCISFFRTVLVSPFMYIKKALFYPFTKIPMKDVLKNCTKDWKNSK